MRYFHSNDGPPIGLDEIQVSEGHSIGLIELTQAEIDSYMNPQKTYQQELSLLNYEYQLDVDKFNRSFAIAYLSDGPSQESKQATIRSQYEVRKTQHAENVAALKSRYGV